MNFQYKTDFLTPDSSFLVGMGSVINIGGNYFEYNTSEGNWEADRKAIFMDWKMIGNDIRDSMTLFSQKIKSESNCILQSK
jgi:hypothetical protein